MIQNKVCELCESDLLPLVNVVEMNTIECWGCNQWHACLLDALHDLNNISMYLILYILLQATYVVSSVTSSILL